MYLPILDITNVNCLTYFDRYSISDFICQQELCVASLTAKGLKHLTIQNNDAESRPKVPVVNSCNIKR